MYCCHKWISARKGRIWGQPELGPPITYPKQNKKKALFAPTLPLQPCIFNPLFASLPVSTTRNQLVDYLTHFCIVTASIMPGMRRGHQKLLNHYIDGNRVNFPDRDEVGRK